MYKSETLSPPPCPPRPSISLNVTKTERSERGGVSTRWTPLGAVLVLCFAASYLLWRSLDPCLNLSRWARLLRLCDGESRELEAEQAGVRTTDLHSNINYTWGKFIWISAQWEISFTCRQRQERSPRGGRDTLVAALFVHAVVLLSLDVSWPLMPHVWNSINPKFASFLGNAFQNCRTVWWTFADKMLNESVTVNLYCRDDCHLVDQQFLFYNNRANISSQNTKPCQSPLFW